MVLDPVNGWPKEKVVVSFCSTSDPALLKNTIEKHPTFLWKWGEHRPVVECNRRNWCSVGVTTSFPACLEMSRQSQLLQWRKMGRALSRGTPHRKRWLLVSHAGALSVHVVAQFPRYVHCVRSPCHWYGMWLHSRRWVFLRNHFPPFSTASPCKSHTFSLCLLV